MTDSNATARAANAGQAAQPQADKLENYRRDYSMFDADLTGNVLNFKLLARLLKWLVPYRVQFLQSAALVLITSTLAVLLPIIISIVVIDHIIRGDVPETAMDLGMIDLTEWFIGTTGLPPLGAACVLYALVQLLWAVTGHYHRMTLVTAVINGLRDLRRDLFAHLETRPSQFYDRVAVGRVMTRVTNDVEALYELLRGMGSLIGELVPFFVALVVMLAISPTMTGILLLALPLMAVATHYFRAATRVLFRQTRQTVSAMNQNLQENLARACKWCRFRSARATTTTAT